MSCRAGTPGWGYKPSLSKSCTMKCEIANCSYCVSDNKCGACNSGYVLNSGKCVSNKPKSCTSIGDYTTCVNSGCIWRQQACYNGNQATYTCNVSNCNKCSSDNYCSSCANGYNLKNGKCEKQISCNVSNCNKCNSDNYCSSCANGYNLKRGKCEKSAKRRSSYTKSKDCTNAGCSWKQGTCY